MALTKVTYSMIENGVINVRDFGAVGNGSTDDTTYLKAAIAKANADKKALYIPAGTYKFTSSLALAYDNVAGSGSIGTAYSGLVVFGDGPDRTILQPTMAGSIAVQLSGNNADTNSNNIPRDMVIRDLSINGTNTSSGTVGLQISQIAVVSITNVKINNFAGYGVNLVRPNHLFTLNFTDCQFVLNRWGMYCDAASNIYDLNMTNCWISSNTVGAARLQFFGASINASAFAGSPYGLYILGSANGTFSGCSLEGNTTYDIWIESSQQIIFNTPRFISNATNAIPVYIKASGGGANRQIDINNARFVAYDLSGAGKNVYQIIDGQEITIGKYQLEACNMGANAEVYWGPGYLSTALGNNYWDNSTDNWYFIPGELRVNNWTPTFTGLTTTGAAPTITGIYTKLGRVVYWTVTIVPGGTTASTLGSTYINNLPYSAYVAGLCNAANNGTLASYGQGVISSGTTWAYTPSWGAVGNTIIISGFYMISA